MAKTRRSSRPLSVDQAIVAVLIAAADANRHISPAEAERAYHLIWFMRRFRRKSGEAVDRLLLGVKERFDRDGEAAVLAAASRVLPAALRASAFATAVDLMLADGRIEPGERAFLRGLATTLKLPAARAEEVVRVMRVKNGA